MIKILFICHGNICRSPMAEFIFRDMVKKAGKSDKYIVSSCATSTEEIWGNIGNPVYPPAKAELLRHGITCEGKRAVQLKKSDYEKYDLFVAMDSMNVRNIMKIFGSDKDNKVHKLLEYAGRSTDVADPWYSRDFEAAYRDIELGCRALTECLEEKQHEKNHKGNA